MRYEEFKKKFNNLPFVVERDILLGKEARQVFRNQLNRWQKRGLVVKLKRGVYMFNRDERKLNPGDFFIANQLCAPSYISLESALSFYGLIPERVADTTSVTTKKTLSIRSIEGFFLYQHIKTIAFRGFRSQRDESGVDFFIAEPEKAVLDFLYLNIDKIPVDNKDIFSVSFRFQNLGGLKARRVIELSKLFGSRKLLKIVDNLKAYIRKG